jgi:hypothetical protein
MAPHHLRIMIKRTPEEWDRWVQDLCQGQHSEAWRGIMCFLRWIQIREENGHPVPTFLLGIEGDLLHSRLLRRLLDKKEPFDYPPPETFGHGWYELVEQGKGLATDVRLWAWAPESKIAINQDVWTILQKVSDTEYLVTYRPDGEPFRLQQLNEKEWLLERVKGDSPQSVEGSQAKS